MGSESDLLRPTTPQYRSASLSDLLPSILSVLSVPGEPDTLGLASALTGVEHVVVVLVDGLGYHLYPEAAETSPVLADAWSGGRGQLRRLTTGFPSTTPTSLTSLGTGATPGEHGVVGFTVNVPGTDRMLVHILWDDDPDPRSWQPRATCFERATAGGVAGYVVDGFSSGLSKAAYRGSIHESAREPSELVDGVRRALARPGPSLVLTYYPGVDRAGHLHGVGSPQWHAEVAHVDRLLTDLTAAGPDTAVLVTADHGMLDIGSRVRIEEEPRLRDRVRVIGGEPRARYIYTEPGAAAEVAETWRTFLGDRAWVLTRTEAVASDWFGPVSPDHLARIGDVIAVCTGDTVILGAPESDAPHVDRLVGTHGALSEAEMAIPLWITRGD
ncbi:putative AlkP superfamily pyrophosphatase or phosphodiesterase [Stackebrandtia endophytica]|uniref:Putative AlkP superfamily pyrophosphatase or phosphodiesterase n=1 Tax=Stackebrandtia endophytica TaxID=1496996 RepID=A0A543ASC5_9ACTN|nr:nucleotide pyrophosphatase/phosphodiesterase family protein [Stackebrandtia endophytica]TQL75484.1 putative AlkP superfamily pyrophosphatase or phosphodiesterase [Stackebrandtia endophytica]